MNQPLEVIKFSRIALDATQSAHAGVERVAAHAHRARSSYWKGIKNPATLSALAAIKLTQIETELDRLLAALDDAAVQLKADAEYYDNKITEATSLQITIERERAK